MRLEFINQDVESRDLSDADRSTIRSVSRRVGAATRRKRGTLAKTNMLQIPDFLIQQAPSGTQLPPSLTYGAGVRSTLSDSSPRLRERQHSHNGHSVTSVPSPLPDATQGRGIPRGLSVLMQPDFTTNLLRHAAVADPNSNPRRWVKICRLAQDSVLQVLPQLYGHSKCLDDSIDCVILRVQHWTTPGSEGQPSQSHIGRTYGRAVQSLSSALATAAVDWTVWYATLLLTLFELLDYSSERAWIMHSRGAFNVLEALGPNGITTEIEKNMLIAQTELMVLEATFANVGVFLEKPEWQNALRSTVIPGTRFEDRSEPVVTLWMITACAPGLFERATKVIMSQNFDPQEALVHKFRALLLNYSRWNARWVPELTAEGILGTRTRIFDDPASMKRAEILVRYLAYIALMNRFFSAIQPHSMLATEGAATSAASRIVQLAELFQTDSVPALGIRLALKIARSIQETARQWSKPGLPYSSGTSITVSPDLFASWCTLLGRATGEPESCMDLG